MVSEIQLQKKSKDKTFRGKTIDELRSLDTREFAKLIKSRPRRALLRNYDKIEQFVERCDDKAKRNRPIKTHSREYVIVPRLVGRSIGIHNGKEYIKIDITEEMLGHRLGEFAITRKQVKHGAAGIGATRSSASQSVK